MVAAITRGKRKGLGLWKLLKEAELVTKEPPLEFHGLWREWSYHWAALVESMCVSVSFQIRSLP